VWVIYNFLKSCLLFFETKFTSIMIDLVAIGKKKSVSTNILFFRLFRLFERKSSA